MMWRGSMNGVTGGLAACSSGMGNFERALSPSLLTRYPAPVSSPIFIKSRRLNCAAISSGRFFAAVAISLYLVRETLWPKTLKYIVPSAQASTGTVRPPPLTVNSAVPCNGLIKRGLLYVLAAPRAASEVEAASLLIDHPKIPRTLLPTDHGDCVYAWLIQRPVP